MQPQTPGELFVEHLLHPRNEGRITAPGLCGRAVSGWKSKGDALCISVRVEGTRIVEARHRVFGGNRVLKACASYLTDAITGREMAWAEWITFEGLGATLDLPPSLMYCAMVAVAAMLMAFAEVDYRRRASRHEILCDGSEALERAP